jgi:predicted DNA-binding transcriptional regulator AlpA
MPKFQRHHLDRRAGQLLADATPASDNDALLDTRQVAKWLGVSEQWLEVGRAKGYGPTCVRLSERNIRYKRKDVISWLKQRQRIAP